MESIYREQLVCSAAAFVELVLMVGQAVCAILVHQIDKKIPIITAFVKTENMMMEQIHVLTVQSNVGLVH